MDNEIIPYGEIASFYDEGYIAEVLFEIKSGKEATVYCAKAEGGRAEAFFALKHYRPLAHRSFQSDAIYHEGRYGRPTRAVRAITGRSRKGREFQFAAWLQHEYATLVDLHAAGADVPRPVAMGGNGLLIEFLGDDGMPAPTLASMRMQSSEAEELLNRLMGNVEIMLSRHVIHADLSAFNILYWRERPVIIDFPQAVDARRNPNASMLLARDIANICRYAKRQGVDCDPSALHEELWSRYCRALL